MEDGNNVKYTAADMWNGRDHASNIQQNQSRDIN